MFSLLRKVKKEGFNFPTLKATLNFHERHEAW